MSTAHDATVPLDQVSNLTPQFAELGVSSKVGNVTLRVGETETKHGYAWEQGEVKWTDVTVSDLGVLADIAVTLKAAGYEVVITEEVETTL